MVHVHCTCGKTNPDEWKIHPDRTVATDVKNSVQTSVLEIKY
jgi:hypothetical protein